MGVAIVPRLAVPDGASDVVVLPLASVPNSVPVTMLWRKRRVLPAALRQFLELVRSGGSSSCYESEVR